jgi:hypothetical protein
MTKGIGWDIGIKNLAYAVIEPKLEASPDSFMFNNLPNWLIVFFF